MNNIDLKKYFNRKNDGIWEFAGIALLIGFAVVLTKDYCDQNRISNLKAGSTENSKMKKSGIDFEYMRSQIAEKAKPDTYILVNGKLFNIDKYARDAEKNFEETEGNYYQ